MPRKLTASTGVRGLPVAAQLALRFPPVWLGCVLALTTVVGGSQSAPRDQAPISPLAIQTGAISGVILSDTATPQPLAGATISLRSDAGLTRTTVSDQRGRFDFPELPAGRFTLSAERQGFVRLTYGAQRHDLPGTPVAMAPGQHVSDIMLKLPRGAVITGSVVDHEGRPVRGIEVGVIGLQETGGERQLIPAIEAAMKGLGVAPTQTDADGAYRLSNVQPGKYVVYAAPRPTDPPTRVGTTYVRTYFPGSTLPLRAVPVTLSAGEERRGIDFLLTPMPTASLRGVVSTALGVPARVQVRLEPHTLLTAGQFAPVQSVIAEPDGRFVFESVAPGEYSLTAAVWPLEELRPSGGATLWGRTDVAVSGVNLRDLVVSAQPSATLSGRVILDGPEPPPDLRTRVSITLRQSGASVLRPYSFLAEVGADGGFQVLGLPPGRYELAALFGFFGPTPPAPPSSPSTGGERPWVVASATFGGRDALDIPIDVAPGENVADLRITFSRATQQISGTLTDAEGRSRPEFTLVIFPRDRQYWPFVSRRTRVARPDTTGRFVVRGLPVGEYFIAAVTDFPASDRSNPAALAVLATYAVPFTLLPGDELVQDLRVRLP